MPDFITPVALGTSRPLDTPISKQQIKSLIAQRITTDGLLETGVTGVKLFRATTSIPCSPAVYDPSVIAIVSGNKEAVLGWRATCL